MLRIAPYRITTLLKGVIIKMKKVIAILTIIMIFILPISNTFNEQKAYANVFSKPITITAKKVAKELAEHAAVEMAEHILFEKAMKEFLEKDLNKVDDGFAPVCLDGKKSLDDCPPDKRAQVKKQLSSTDKNKLSQKVQDVLEKKTNTSSKWGKFLDWFVPIFLISGLVSTIETMMDSDSEGLIDDIAKESLINSGFLKPLTIEGNLGSYQPVNFSEVISEVTYKVDSGYHNNHYLKVIMVPNASFSVYINDKRHYINTSREIWVSTASGVQTVGREKYGLTTLTTFNLGTGQNYDLNYKPTLYQTEVKNWGDGDPMLESQQKADKILSEKIQGATINDTMNNFLGLIAANVGSYSITLNPIVQPPVQTNFSDAQIGVEKLKDSEGKVTVPGIESFSYTYNNTNVYPSSDSTTGWKDKATDIDIAVVEDDVIVDGDKLDPDAPKDEDELNTDKDKDRIKKKSRDWSGLLTTRFPFSLPWDFLYLMKVLYAEPMTPHWEVKGTDKIPFDLDLDLKFLDSYAPWFRTFILLSFIISVIFLHGRFMGGSK